MQDLIGSTLGHYRVVEKIGTGGMGVVHLARDERLDRDVAIKTLPEDLAADPDRLRRFEREAKLLASLSHQNIATLYCLEEHGGRRFLVMELAAGETLAERLKRRPISLQDALEIALEIAEGLEAAHARGIIHRDLKPANVMLSPEGKVKILDFDQNPQGTYDVWILPLDGESEAYPFVQTRFEEAGGDFSPDGRWLAYQSTESGRWEVYVTPFPGPGRKWQARAVEEPGPIGEGTAKRFSTTE
jgi:serine/threonine protein kinase